MSKSCFTEEIFKDYIFKIKMPLGLDSNSGFETIGKSKI
jgi:hypothetical protein